MARAKLLKAGYGAKKQRQFILKYDGLPSSFYYVKNFLILKPQA